ncbi:MAG: hypothetical protein IAG13_24450 [Deltaproteobacteria bacterium]|nr:hypothetical protein [Nannocystaceae bacterium]
MPRLRAIIVTVLATASALAGCPDDGASNDDDGSSGATMCGEISCSDRVRVSFTAPSGQLGAGAYTVAWSSDGVDDDCSFTLVADAEACDGDPPCVTADDCDADFGLVGAPQFVALDIPGKPALLELTVLRDQAIVLEDGFAPQYADVHPNGEACPPTCALAEASFDLP